MLLDGHSRLGIALHLGLGYTLAPVPVDGIEDAERWVLANQRARRNMRPEALQLLRGRLYNLEKRQGGRTHTYTSRQSGEKLPAQRLAGEFGVGARTIERDGALVEALDAITAEHGRQLLDAYVSGEKGLTRKHVLKVASLSSNRRGEFIKHVCEVKVPVGEALSYALKPEWSDEQVANAEAALTAQAQLLAQAIEGARGALGEVAPAMERWALRTRPKDHAAVVAFRAAQKKVADGLKAMTELLPHRPCDDCLGNDPSCAECAGVGWFPKGRASWDM
ncbi:MAG TPA: hypothetical protein ENK57_00965 [Polyangiaceae bacterium]|nr:hypothetical protein [Polyangiaceae bacterium]